MTPSRGGCSHHRFFWPGRATWILTNTGTFCWHGVSVTNAEMLKPACDRGHDSCARIYKRLSASRSGLLQHRRHSGHADRRPGWSGVRRCRCGARRVVARFSGRGPQRVDTSSAAAARCRSWRSFSFHRSGRRANHLEPRGSPDQWPVRRDRPITLAGQPASPR